MSNQYYYSKTVVGEVKRRRKQTLSSTEASVSYC